MRGFQLSLRNDPPQSIEEMRQAALRRLPAMVSAYLESGAEDMVTLARNQSAYGRTSLRMRALTGFAAPKTGSVMCGESVSIPLALAPTGASGLFHRDADLATFRAAERAGTRAALSTAASIAMEDVAEATEHRHWFQLYPSGDSDMVGRLIDRAAQAGYSALFVTVDMPVPGNRNAERAAGMGLPMRLNPRRLANLAMHPRWLWSVARHKRFVPVHMVNEGRRDGTSTVVSASAAQRQMGEITSKQSRLMQSTLDWNDLAWIRDKWKGRLYVKGILDVEDADRLAGLGWLDGIIVSNHGGRQLDRSQSTLSALRAIAAEVGSKTELYLDGGVRRGTDIIAAMCCGARGVFIGRPYLYGLACGGEQGVQQVLSIFADELRRAMILMGCPDVRELGPQWLAGQELPD